jgi:hypothetical protein
MKRLLALLLLCLALAPLSNTTVFSQTAPPDKTEKKTEKTEKTTQGKPDVKVWVNTSSGVYHCPGTRWYGATKHGEYMTQKQAQEKGNRAAYGKVCQ